VATEPRRVVVELHPADYEVLATACRNRRLTPPELIQLVALRLARGAAEPQLSSGRSRIGVALTAR
jgi:hypothetical protein